MREQGADFLEAFDQKNTSLLNRNKLLRKTRDLLPKLVSGQSDVEHPDSDVGEDAGVEVES